MVGANAPARRVGWFAERDTLTALNETGLRLFDAAVLWAAGRLEIVPQLDRLGDLIRGAGQSPTANAWQAGVAYAVGDQAMFGGAIYHCRQAHTSQVGWEPPNVFALWERIDTSGVWLPQVTYKVGDQVTFQGHTYRCLQTHLSQPDWQPPSTPALWQLVA